LVVETFAQCSSYVLRFHISPQELLEETTKEIQSLRSIYSSCPVFGVEFEVDADVTKQPAQVRAGQDDVEIETTAEQSDAFAAYLKYAAKASDCSAVQLFGSRSVHFLPSAKYDTLLMAESVPIVSLCFLMNLTWPLNDCLMVSR